MDRISAVERCDLQIMKPCATISAENWAVGSDGRLSKVWEVAGANVVVDQGKGQMFNRALGFQTASTFGPYLALHSATTASNSVWSNVSASEVISYGNNRPQISFASTYTNGSCTGTASFGFTASTQTLSGCCVLWYTTNTMSTNAATGDIKMYNMGQFAASQQVQNGNTISVSVTLSLA